MNNVRYKTARLLKKTSMYRSRYVYNRHYLPRAVCLTDPPQLTPVSLPQQGPITPCIFFSNTKSVKNSTRDFFKKKNMFQVFFFFFPCQRNHPDWEAKSLKILKAHFISHKRKS